MNYDPELIKIHLNKLIELNDYHHAFDTLIIYLNSHSTRRDELINYYYSKILERYTCFGNHQGITIKSKL